MSKYFASAALLGCAAYAMALICANVDALVGAYGDGPPYYGRTTNMDKWEDPLPTLAVVDVISAIALYFLILWALRRLRPPRREARR